MSERTTCCVVGGGPAGMMLGLLLARAGVEVTVLEKHGDFLRDFRQEDKPGRAQLGHAVFRTPGAFLGTPGLATPR